MRQVNQPTLSSRLDEREQQMNEDYEWCPRDLEVRRKYGGKVVVAYQHKILGAGKSPATAVARHVVMPLSLSSPITVDMR